MLCYMADTNCLDMAFKYNARSFYGILGQERATGEYFKTPLWYAWKLLQTKANFVQGTKMFETQVTGDENKKIDAFATGDLKSPRIILINRSFDSHVVKLNIKGLGGDSKDLVAGRYIFNETRSSRFIGRWPGTAYEGEFENAPADSPRDIALEMVDQLPLAKTGVDHTLQLDCGPISITVLQVHPPGDFELDGDVDFKDFAVFAENWSCPSQLCRNDLNGDGYVDCKDLAEFAENWLTEMSTDNQYGFYRTISRDVLEKYLARSVSITYMINETANTFDDQMRMIDNIGAKFLGRAFCAWAAESWQVYQMNMYAYRVQEIHDIDPDIIVQGSIFEVITTSVGNVPIPSWVFDEFGVPREIRNFNYDAIRYANNRYKDHWGVGQSVPDISRLETKMWFYFMARLYIDSGYEAIHFGQVDLMDDNDSSHAHWWDVLSRIRNYAAGHARRGLVLCDAHTHGVLYGNNLLFDFHSYPMRPKDNCSSPENAYLEVGHLDSIYGKSASGWTSSGWYADGGLPYLVEQDNWGAPVNPGICDTGTIRVWGYDEISWFAKQSGPYRNSWLQYAYDWVRTHDTNGFFEIAASRNYDWGGGNTGWYYANTPSVNMPSGGGQEEAIKGIWEKSL
jgi:hypothetical protein